MVFSFLVDLSSTVTHIDSYYFLCMMHWKTVFTAPALLAGDGTV